MELELAGKVARVTGTSRGIGGAKCSELAAEGMHLSLVARDETSLRNLATRLGNSGQIRTHVHATDLRHPGAAQVAVNAAIGALGRVDLLVNNAGATKRADFFTLAEDDWQGGFGLKFHGYVRLTRATWPHLRQSGGTVVNIVGVGSRAGAAEFTIGGAVNVAPPTFTKAMANIGVEHGVRVNAINPSLIETGHFIRNMERVMRNRALERDDAVRFPRPSHGTKHVGRAEEIGTLTHILHCTKPILFRDRSSTSTPEQRVRYEPRCRTGGMP